MLIAARSSFASRPRAVQLEWLYGKGPQWIDTGLTLTQRHSATIRFMIPSTANTYVTVFGARKGWKNYAFCLFRDTATSGGCSVSVGFAGATLSSSGYSLRDGAWHTVTLSSSGCVFDGRQAASWSSGTFSTPATAKLFGLNWNGGGGVSDNIGAVRISSFSVLDGADLVLDLAPFRDRSGCFMLDRVSGACLRNMGTGAFTPGPDKPRFNHA